MTTVEIPGVNFTCLHCGITFGDGSAWDCCASCGLELEEFFDDMDEAFSFLSVHEPSPEDFTQ
jgi:hypothetical protein